MMYEKDKFETWMINVFHNKNTRRQYYLREQDFIKRYTDEIEITQENISKYYNYAISMGNPHYIGFIKAFVDCYNENMPENEQLLIYEQRSRSHNSNYDPNDHKYISKEDLLNKIDILKHTNYQLYLMALIYFETGLRAIELLNIHNSREIKIDNEEKEKDWGWDLQERVFWGIGKGNKPFKATFSKQTANLIINWLSRCKNPNFPFIFYRKNGDPIKNQYSYVYKRYVKLGFTPHQIRHGLGHHLRTKMGWDIEQIRAKLGHESIKTTQIYVKSTKKEIKELEEKTLFNEDILIPNTKNSELPK